MFYKNYLFTGKLYRICKVFVVVDVAQGVLDHRAVFADFLIGDDGFTCVCYRVAERVVPVVVEIVILIRTGVLNLIRLRKAVQTLCRYRRLFGL